MKKILLITLLLLLASCAIPQGGRATAQARACTDTDNSNTFELAFTEPPGLSVLTRPDAFTFGSVSTIDDRGRPMKHEDSCFVHPAARMVVLLEKHCDAEAKVREQIIRCPKGCKDGACIGTPAPTPPVPAPVAAPRPAPAAPAPTPTAPVPQPPAPTTVPTAQPVTEKPADAKQATPVLTCTDSDNGKDYRVKGTARVKDFFMEDRCFGDKILEEMYCHADEPNEVLNVFRTCSLGCKEGICAGTTSRIECIDSDNGLDYFKKGETTSNAGTGAFDACFGPAGVVDSSDTLWEAYCLEEDTEKGDGSTHKIITCANGCKDGACLPTTKCAQDEGKPCGCGGTTNCDGSCSKPACLTGQTCTNGQCTTPCSTQQGQACNRNACGGSGTVQCDGSCSAPAPFVPTNLGAACNRNQCGGSGTVDCSGGCNSGSPFVPSNLGQSCGCGGNIQCSGQCSNSGCPSEQVCNNGQCGCVSQQGQACGNYGTYDCVGNCVNQCAGGQVRANDGVCTVPCGRCLVAPATNCDQACQNLRQGYTSGTCAAPTSTNVGACCACYKPPAPTYTAPTYTAPTSNCRTGTGTCRMQDSCPAYMHKVWTNGNLAQGCVNVYSIISTRVCGTTTGGIQCDGSSSTGIYRDQCVCP